MKAATPFIGVWDTHGDMADPGTLKVIREVIRTHKPQIRIAGGDHFDMRCLRRGASRDEEFESLEADIDAGCDFLRWFKPTHWLRGNHDERLWDAAKGKNPVASRFAYKQTRDILEIVGDAKVYPYDRRAGVLRLGHLKAIHGYHSGMFAARQAAQIYGSILMGHGHAIDYYSVPGLEMRVGQMVGCACRLDMDYNRAQANTLRQAHGFVYGFLLPGGEYVVWQAREINRRWYLPTKMKEVAV